jgi:hypothetical protein
MMITTPLDICQGQQYKDNANNTYKWKADQVVDIAVEINAAHGGELETNLRWMLRSKLRVVLWYVGTANVSIVDTATNSIVGDMLRESFLAPRPHRASCI